MIIYGTGGHAHVITALCERVGISVDAYIDNDISRKHFNGKAVCHHLDERLSEDGRLFIAIGHNAVREKISLNTGLVSPKLIDKTAFVDQTVQVGEGCYIGPKVVLQATAQVGEQCIINSGAIVEHGAIVGDYVYIASGAIVMGDAQIGKGAMIDAGAIIGRGISISPGTKIPMGAVITEDI